METFAILGEGLVPGFFPPGQQDGEGGTLWI